LETPLDLHVTLKATGVRNITQENYAMVYFSCNVSVPVLKKLSMSKLSGLLLASSANAGWAAAIETPSAAKFKNCFRLCMPDGFPPTSVFSPCAFKAKLVFEEAALLEINASTAAKKVNGNKNFMFACRIDVVVSDFQAMKLFEMMAKAVLS
jgi:hypothetical protein